MKRGAIPRIRAGMITVDGQSTAHEVQVRVRTHQCGGGVGRVAQDAFRQIAELQRVMETRQLVEHGGLILLICGRKVRVDARQVQGIA